MISFQLVYNIKSYKQYSDNFNSRLFESAIIVRSLKFLCMQYLRTVFAYSIPHGNKLVDKSRIITMCDWYVLPSEGVALETREDNPCA